MAINYTYDDFQKELQRMQSSYGAKFNISDADLKLAQKNATAGMGILAQKDAWLRATTDDQKALANDEANRIRKEAGGYTAGVNGATFTPSGFGYEREGQIDATLDKIVNPESFSYDYRTDPIYQQYAEAYERNGKNAMEDSYGMAAAKSGGIGGSYAQTAAQQTYNNYMAALNDKVPELEQNAYSRYISEYNRELQALDALNADRNVKYGQWSDGQNLIRQDEATAWERQWAQQQQDYERQWNEDERTYARAQQEIQNAIQRESLDTEKANKAMSILLQFASAGQKPDAEQLAAAAQISVDEAKKIIGNINVAAFTPSTGASGGTGRANTGSGTAQATMTEDQRLVKAADVEKPQISDAHSGYQNVITNAESYFKAGKSESLAEQMLISMARGMYGEDVRRGEDGELILDNLSDDFVEALDYIVSLWG